MHAQRSLNSPSDLISDLTKRGGGSVFCQFLESGKGGGLSVASGYKQKFNIALACLLREQALQAVRMLRVARFAAG